MTITLRSLFVIACLLPSFGQAATVTLVPTADAYVQNGNNAAKNYGTSTQLRAQTNATAASNYDSYLKFDTTTASGQITSAKLRLYASLSKTDSVSSSAYSVADTSWGETTLTWNNKPVVGAALGSISVTTTAYAWKEIDITAYLQSERNANRTLISVAYRAPVSSLLTTLQSREGANKPQLVIITAPPANVLPTVSMTGPADGSSYPAPASITLSANASDSDGSIAAVEFYNGASLIGSTPTAPYAFTWSNVPVGNYSVRARAVDNLGGATYSNTLAVNVIIPPPPASASLYYLYADHLNTPRVATDSTNKVVWRWDSDAFGTSTANEDPDGDGVKFTYNPRFPGQYFDKETGLHYNYFRDYEPGTGRYVQSDPIGLAGGLNTYGYVGGNPLSFTDPAGLQAGAGAFPGAGPVPSPAAHPVFQRGTPANDAFVSSSTQILNAVSNAMHNAVDAVKNMCKDDSCPPCQTVSGKVVPVGTISYRPLDTPSKPEHGIVGPHYNIYKANQIPAPNCNCFWQPLGAVRPSDLPAGAIPIEHFAK